ncbi:MAG TPA: hypothetical protein VFJ51_00685, partial [Nitrososphaeraceae archaeon]|nr:hypothetical protein [Nitrososphaeraceae archaeon]
LAKWSWSNCSDSGVTPKSLRSDKERIGLSKVDIDHNDKKMVISIRKHISSQNSNTRWQIERSHMIRRIYRAATC